MGISLVTTTFNDEDEILRFLDNIMIQSMLPSEIVISDGGSKDHTVSLIQSYSRKNNIPIKLRHGKRLNIAEGFNDAIKHSGEEIIFIAGLGNSFPSDFLEKLYNSMLFTKADVVCPHIFASPKNKFTKAYGQVYLRGEKGGRGQSAPNHGSLVKRSVFETYGYFWEYFIYAGEDAEFFGFAASQGCTLVSDPEIKVFWDTPSDWKQLFRQTKWYAIGWLQCYSAPDTLWINKKPIFKVLLFSGAFFLLAFPYAWRIGMFMLFLFLLDLIYLVLKYGFLGFGILMIRQYGKLFNYMRYVKYWGKRYHVDRIRRR